MKAILASLVVLCFSTTVMAEEIFRIEVGRDFKQYSHSDLQRRVWDLERAVWQLQQRVFQLESKAPTADSWICTIKAMGDTYTGTGATKAVATSRAIENCKAAREGDGFFCKDAKCEQ